MSTEFIKNIKPKMYAEIGIDRGITLIKEIKYSYSFNTVYKV